MNKIGAHQLLPSLEDGDAIGSYARLLQAALRADGREAEIFVFRKRPGQRDCRSFRKHQNSRKEDILIFHTSIGSPLAPYFAATPGRKVLVHHNITPARFFAGHKPEDAWLAILARKQLRDLAGIVEAAVADSAYNAKELVELGYPVPSVIPLPLSPERSGEASAEPRKNTILFVGRVAPNKRQDELVRVLAAYREIFDPSARLVLVGDTENFPTYAARIRGLIAAHGLEKAVELTGKIPDEDLRARYAEAAVFVCLSLHEGFGVPLIEASAAGVPVLARDAGAAADTLGEAGVIFAQEDPVRIASLIHLLARDTELRRRVLAAQARRVAYFRDFPFAESWRGVLAPLLAAG